MEAKDLVEKKLRNWELKPNCILEKNKMIALEEKKQLSYKKIKELSYIPCNNCEYCLGQKTLDDY